MLFSKGFDSIVQAEHFAEWNGGNVYRSSEYRGEIPRSINTGKFLYIVIWRL